MAPKTILKSQTESHKTGVFGIVHLLVIHQQYIRYRERGTPSCDPFLSLSLARSLARSLALSLLPLCSHLSLSPLRLCISLSLSLSSAYARLCSRNFTKDLTTSHRGGENNKKSCIKSPELAKYKGNSPHESFVCVQHLHMRY